MRVFIFQHHCTNTNYADISDCPLNRAIRESYPDLVGIVCGGTSVYVGSLDKTFMIHSAIPYSSESIYKLSVGLIQTIEITLIANDNFKSYRTSK